MKAYISKYALERGIVYVNGEVSDYGQQFTVNNYHVYGPGHWHKTKKDAIEAANTLRDDEIEVLQKKIGKLQRLVFE